jgi:hypothetical protein
MTILTHDSSRNRHATIPGRNLFNPQLFTYVELWICQAFAPDLQCSRLTLRTRDGRQALDDACHEPITNTTAVEPSAKKRSILPEYRSGMFKQLPNQTRRPSIYRERRNHATIRCSKDELSPQQCYSSERHMHGQCLRACASRQSPVACATRVLPKQTNKRGTLEQEDVVGWPRRRLSAAILRRRNSTGLPECRVHTVRNANEIQFVHFRKRNALRLPLCCDRSPSVCRGNDEVPTT